MTKLDQLTESFRMKWEKILIGCDAAEEGGQWDSERNGSLGTYYSLDLIGAILRLIAADGKVTEQETEYLNDAFGFDYDTDELKEVWTESADNLGEDFEKRFASGLARLTFLSEELAADYRELLHLISDIIIESDGVTAPEELEAVRRLKAF